MLIQEDILSKMKQHFPKWMDIRRKVTSSGSLLLETLASETSEIKNAIEDYKKDFFIDNYKNPNDILTFVYKAEIGKTDIKNIKVLSPNLSLTDNQKDFYDNDLCFYDEGILYFKKDYKNIEYSIKNFKSTAKLERINVWNVFDEFAAFVGLKRYEDETNQQLEDRILCKSQLKINSSRDGLKNALLANLSNLDPELKKEEILIEPPTPENLLQYYDKFNTVLDKLSSVNRDVYKNKKWDIDTWNFPIKSLDYIPHAWDVILSSIQDGIGDGDDLKVAVIDNDDIQTNATLSFYQKKKEVLDTYLKNSNEKKEITFNLQRYEEQFSTDKILYSINASERAEIHPRDIKIDLVEEFNGDKDIYLEDLADKYWNLTENKKILNKDYNYIVRLIPVDPLKAFRIRNLGLKNLKDNSIKSYLKAQPGFVQYNSLSKYIQCAQSVSQITEKYQCEDLNNIIKSQDGFEINDYSAEGKIVVDLNGMGNEPLFYQYTIPKVPYIYNNIVKKNCYVVEDTIVADTVDDERYIKINDNLNFLSLDIEGTYTIEYKIGDENVNIITQKSKKYHFTSDKYDSPQLMYLKVTLGPGSKIKNILYSKYKFNMKTEKSEFTHNEVGCQLPSYDKNKLLISMKTYVGFSPVLKYIYIGSPLTKDNYYGDITITDIPDNNVLYVDADNATVDLTVINKTDKSVVKHYTDYIPHIEFSDDHNESVNFTLDSFTDINSIEGYGCNIATETIGDNTICYLSIPKGISVFKITVNGSYKKQLKSYSLMDILKKKGYSDSNRFYISNNTNYIMTEANPHFCLITKEDITGGYNIGEINISCLNDNADIIPKFIERNQDKNKSTIISYNAVNNFNYLTFCNKLGKNYEAINSTQTYSPITEGTISNTFSKGFDPTKKMVYIVKSLNEDFNVVFSQYIDKDDNSSIQDRINKICLKDNMNISFNQEIQLSFVQKNIYKKNFSIETKNIKTEIVLNTIVAIPILKGENNNVVNIDQYTIENKDIKIKYKNKNNSETPENFLQTEILYINENLFNKLTYCNVDEIVSINLIDKDSNNVLLIENQDFKLDYRNGIIIWNSSKIERMIHNGYVVIKYYINKAYAIEFDVDYLYKKINYTNDSLNLLNQIELEKISNNQSINLKLYDSYLKSDITIVKCSQPGFSASIKNDILKFKKTIPSNTIAIKSGYYYMDGNEYYLFANEKFDNIESIDNIALNNVDKINSKLIFKQQTTNFITNSSMETNIVGTVFKLNCRDKKIKGSSTLNSISSCESYNYWTSIASDMSITKGYNGQGLSFRNLNDSGCIYIPLTEFIEKYNKYVVSFYLSGNAHAYLGKERIIYSINSKFNQKSVVDIIEEINQSTIINNIYEKEIDFTDPDNNQYYLILTGNGTIDDLLIIEKNKYSIDLHTRNIDSLKLNIEENIYSEFKTRLFLQENDGAVFDGTEIKKGHIVNTSYIDWGFTNIKNFSKYEDFEKCQLLNISLEQFNDKCIAKTESEPGKIITPSIYVGNKNIIKNLLFKINDIMFENMKGFKISVLTSNNINTSFNKISSHLDNIGCVDGEKLKSYIKLMIEIPSNKVINNIDLFIEYKSSEKAAPADLSVLSGSYTSKVLDAQYTERFQVTDFNFDSPNRNLDQYIFQIRASKNNDQQTVWTDWKTIQIKDGKIANRIIFDGYRFFQFKVILKGEDSSIKINNIDLEVI